MLKRLDKNTIGNDYVVGDIHGNFTKLMCAMLEVNFDESKDRLICVGDMIDKGKQSHLVCEWLSYPWFFSVRGNHEDFAIRYARKISPPIDPIKYKKYGGGWFMALPECEQLVIAEALEKLPLVIEVETSSGLVGVVHADSPYEHWSQLTEALMAAPESQEFKFLSHWLMWSRDRFESAYMGHIQGITKLVVGHTRTDEPVTLGNVVYIDTKGYQPGGHFTLLQIQ
jgi:serine/threonine protein phosphatase 1